MKHTKEQVRRGKAAVAQMGSAKWDLGDLALEILPEDLDQHDPDYEELKVYAEAIDIDIAKLMLYRRVAATFEPHIRRDDVAWSTHRDMATEPRPGRLLHQRKVWTWDSLREYKASHPGPGVPISAGQTPVSPPVSGTKPQTRDEKIAIAREAMKDDEMAAEVFRDHDTLLPAGRAQFKAVQEKHEAMDRDFELNQPERAASYAAADKEIFKSAHDLNTDHLILKASQDLREAMVERTQGTGQPLREAMRGALDRIIGMATALRDSSGTSLEDELSKILEEDPH